MLGYIEFENVTITKLQAFLFDMELHGATLKAFPDHSYKHCPVSYSAKIDKSKVRHGGKGSILCKIGCNVLNQEISCESSGETVHQTWSQCVSKTIKRLRDVLTPKKHEEYLLGHLSTKTPNRLKQRLNDELMECVA